ncbi:GDYXXLXY domain-containing protein [Candidatus Berkiella aquae]|uniref:GDYXXLXY domain-containing protein n=1 Tax=Candidatus Berkiella aquae TaxID=295108 RepID=A0A0Q9YXH8_9GAMM|nr:GDYXXLXY domain-containing protein [Candidatus Berkiella aquae]MCS5712348.1 GDYXXLXY domain-containing protein [Candidatus Berkiella aquae]
MIRDATLFIVTILIFVIFNVMIYQKQQILKSGDSIYFAIEPADPRSLMQGDYMTFRYVLEEDLKKNDSRPQSNQGYIVIVPDENKIGQFARFYSGEKLGPHEKLLQYRYHPSRFSPYLIKPHTFFFQEKRQPDLQEAKFAVFHYQGNKNYLLTGLANKDKNIISGK